MKHGYCFFLFLFMVVLAPWGRADLIAQQRNAVKLSGRILDGQGQAGLGFATVSVYLAGDTEGKLVNGGISQEDGRFSLDLNEGTYDLLLEFMGYEARRIEGVQITRDRGTLDLGEFRLQPSTASLDEVVVTGEKSFMELSLDKRIFNVGKDLANAGGTATDILMNLPSVNVDPEGNVRLRGSDNVRILIDGKPSGLVSFKGSSGLQQLPANLIESVEVITNPSARYEAEGMAGVINIVLKKENAQGFNASFEGITGNPTNLGFAANLNYRHNKINWFVNYGLAYRRVPREGFLRQDVTALDSTFYTEQFTTGTVNSINNNIRAGLDYFFNEKSILTGSYLLRRSDSKRITDIRYEDYFSNGVMEGYYHRRQDEDEKEPNSEYNVSYRRSFDQAGHQFTAAVTYLDYWENSDQVYTEFGFQPNGIPIPSRNLLQTSINDEYERQWLFQLDYTKPVFREGNFEAGIRSSFRDMENDFIVSEQQESGDFEPLPGLDDIFLYDENIHAAYAILGNKNQKLSYQGGIRAEYTDVKTTLVRANSVNPRQYGNLFPSAHITYNLSSDDAMQVSYSRRIRRPFYNDLSPFMTFSDARNFFSGNPDLDPEFTDAYELGHIKYMDRGSIFSTVYFRNTKDKIERIRTVDEEGNAMTLPENLLSERSYGAEFTSDYNPTDWWKIDLNLNLFYAQIDGSNIMEDYKRDTYSWFARFTSRFSLPNTLDIQVRTNYEGRQRVAQGIRKALYYADISASRDVFNGRGTLILNVMDIANTRRTRMIFEGPGFITESDVLPRRRQINLSLNYRIRQSKTAKKSDILGTE
ncbi:TonB-dependent receptor [Lunatimonas lonarensis]|uniref:TonB-dependent receptor n=1 Tax=Lunatimonas lonarensis TaxID=1232681 RepID=R7ZTI4_9BACT|nr:outer membrane beta-barrel family protein [Lunatimonas lonarensis]EON77348.1 TonB-dependent receptor [Lunatimonas lonarensis]